MTDFTKLSLAWYNSPHFIDFTDRQRAMLIMVSRQDAILGVRELAGMMRVQKPVVTRAASTLEHLGLLKRVKNEDDKRLIYFSLTTRGVQIVSFMAEIGR